jgi:hypothetical protein
MALSFGPDVILRCYENESTNPLDPIANDDSPHVLNGYLSHPLSRIFEERKIDGSSLGAYKPVILDTVYGENDRCKPVTSSSEVSATNVI